MQTKLSKKKRPKRRKKGKNNFQCFHNNPSCECLFIRRIFYINIFVGFVLLISLFLFDIFIKMKIKQLQKLYFTELANIYSDIEIKKLFEIFTKEYIKYNKIELLINTEEELSEKEISKFKKTIIELKSGKPYQHILHKAYFYNNEFFINENVLIPRPETEELVELALNKLNSIGDKKLKILDIGTGSGCIAITLAKYIKKSVIYAVDFSLEALDIAKKNMKIDDVEVNFTFIDYLSEDIGKISDSGFDVIISNPPYISVDEENFIEKQVKNFEPKMALFAPKEDPLAFYRKIYKDAQLYLSKGGFLFLEINQKFGNETFKLFSKKFKSTQLIKDISGNDRFILVEN